MHLTNVRRLSLPASANGFQAVAKFNLQVNDGLTLYDFQLVRAPSGKMLVYAPFGKNGTPTASMAPALRDALIEMGDDALKENVEYDRAA